MLAARLILSVAFVALLVGLCWLDNRAARPGTYLLPLAMVVAALGAGELLAMFRQRGSAPRPVVIYAGVLFTVLMAGIPAGDWVGATAVSGIGWIAIGLVASFLLAILGELPRYEGTGAATTNLALSSLAILYIGGLVGFMVQLRLIHGVPGGANNQLGMLALVSLIATVKMSDIGQYTVGRLFGRHKLAPWISPGKTWEGAVGGLLFAIVAAWIVFTSGADAIVGAASNVTGGTTRVRTVTAIILFATAVAAAGMLGDLAESMFKRDAGVKDSSTWMPGFGGVLDLLDSLLGAAPVAYVFWAFGWIGA